MLSIPPLAGTRLGGYYRGKRVLVTGHTGLLGQWVVEILLQCGAEPIGLSRGDVAGFGERCDALPGDVRRQDAVTAAVAASGASTILHLAGWSRARAGAAERKSVYETNILGTLNILEAAAALAVAGCVVVSSSRDPGRASADRDMWDAYNASKRAMEYVVFGYRHEALHAEPARGIAVARPAVLIGGGDRLPGRLVPDLIAALRRGEDPRPRNPVSYRPWQHAVEAAAGVLWLAAVLGEKPGELAPSYNFGLREPSAPVLADEVARRIAVLWAPQPGGAADALPRRDALQDEPAEGFWLDGRHAYADLGWAPCWTLQQALAATVMWYRTDEASQRAAQGIMSEQVTRYASAATALGVSWAQPHHTVGEPSARASSLPQ